ncbi:hypothetical protein [Roseomonas haemaphysalidis]|jgi:hypothetical protein|uniref:Uncharacterized protein n=1 Tax=Roseomonas haemaphysalidis TaxID=2768162 RepID=A0ABS3KV53_9PROT|nr:hypothetical protein [Roseomonas haemaphysalidis]MBO1080211.1 hypothetical protein [Roseomonas haemaphysalidis]
MIRNSMIAAALLATGMALGATSALHAQEAVINQGEQFHVSYPAGYTGNIVGGGDTVTVTSGRYPQVTYTGAFHENSAGIPVFTGGSEGGVAYLPAPATAGTVANR